MNSTGKPEFSGLDRRGFLAGAATLAAVTALPLRAQGDTTLRIGFISPRSGPLAAFGQGDDFVIAQVRAAVAGGIEIAGTTYTVEIIDRDTQSDPSRAAQLANDLINNEGVDLMLASSTPETINPVADSCEAAGVPCLSTVMPWEAWYFGRGAKPDEPSPFKWSYHFGFGVGEFAKAYITQWNLIETNRKVGVLYPNDADGNAVRAMLAPQLADAGFEIVDPGAFENLTVDYSAQIRAFKEAGVEIINSFALPPDFAAFWRQAAQQGLLKDIKIGQVAKTGLFPSDIEAMGSLGPGLSSAAYWHRDMPYSSPVTGQSAEALAAGYEAETGTQWVQSLGASTALFDVGIAALTASAAPKDKAAVAAAIAGLRTDTIGGVVDFTAGPVPNVAHGPLVGTQWVEGTGAWPIDYVVTENTTDPNLPVVGTLHAYNE
ncbi:ABC transporter substrate-binding protein [Sinisalibacter aestuarii]|uniref:ABC transporter substrate-binding protein n=1 Tax=Sinisalibacter aestuarii TaxID=2949426 RepID=A0ABQ5LYT0_9RHOB|nr:ABC transporter substrate-binding protein [Sinisalibacter aestuarii]GKY90121.1 ABC transporter substrate-binding protein [Sinisalibacter aestuarii]